MGRQNFIQIRWYRELDLISLGIPENEIKIKLYVDLSNVFLCFKIPLSTVTPLCICEIYMFMFKP